MKRMFLVLAASAIALTGFSSAYVQASSSDDAKTKAKRQCFRTERIQKWATDKDRLIYIRLTTGAVFRVTVAHECPGLGMYQTIAFDTDFGSELCEGQHATIITRSGAGPLHCPVGAIQALTPEEAKALPDHLRP